MEEPVGGYSIATMRALFAFQGSKTPACLATGCLKGAVPEGDFWLGSNVHAALCDQAVGGNPRRRVAAKCLW